MKKIGIVIIALVSCLRLQAQVNTTPPDSVGIGPVESAQLRGPREATTEEKEYARMLNEDRKQQEQIRFVVRDERGTTPIDSVVAHYKERPQTSHSSYSLYAPAPLSGFTPWQLHKGLNVNLGASVFASFGGGSRSGAGFTQDINLLYLTDLSPKATLAVGGYLSNIIWGGDNYTVAGLTALLNYRFNEHWSAYAFVQKAFSSNNMSPWRSVYPYGRYAYYGSMHPWGYGGPYWALDSRMMDRFGAGVRYDFKNNSYIQIQVEVDRMPEQRTGFYNHQRYDYPVR